MFDKWVPTKFDKITRSKDDFTAEKRKSHRRLLCYDIAHSMHIAFVMTSHIAYT